MDQTLFALPILPGQTDPARAFLAELEGARKPAYAASEGRLGLTKEVWAIQTGPGGDLYVVYFAGADVLAAFGQFAASRDDFDLWFKERVRVTTGLDLNTPPPGLPSEILSDFVAS